MGTTIGAILISYDVDRLNPEVKAGLIKLGYSDRCNYANDNKFFCCLTPLYGIPTNHLIRDL